MSICLTNVKWVVKTIAILHNYCINERLARDPGYTLRQSECTGLSATELSQMEASSIVEHSIKLSKEFPQWSMAREDLVKRVSDLKLERPKKKSRK